MVESSCLICSSSIIDSESDNPNTNLQNIFTKSVLKLYSHSLSKSTTTCHELKFCQKCCDQLNTLQTIEMQIQDLQVKCKSLEEELLCLTLETMIKKSTSELQENDSDDTGKRVGQLALRISKKSPLCLKIYKKWRLRLIKLLKEHAIEGSYLTTSAGSGAAAIAATTDPVTFQSKSQSLLSFDMLRTATSPIESDLRTPVYIKKLDTLQMDHPYVSPHLLMEHDIPATPNKPDESKGGKSSRSRKRSRFPGGRTNEPCSHCKEIFSSKVDLKHHIKAKHLQKQPCEIRSALLDDVGGSESEQLYIAETLDPEEPAEIPQARHPREARLDVPNVGVGSEILRLNLCSADISNPEDSKRHDNYLSENETPISKELAKQEKERKFKCDWERCGKLFFSKKQLQVHTRIHTGLKRYLCDTCGSMFLSLASLHSHRKTHSGVKPYVCQVCNRSFRSAGHLNNHSLIHSGEKPFACSICEKLFNRKENLRVHEFTHATVKPHKCPKCTNVSFTRPTLLRKHLEEKHSMPSGNKSKSKSSSLSTLSVPGQDDTLILHSEQQAACTTILLEYTSDHPRPTSKNVTEITAVLEPIDSTSAIQQAYVLPDGQYIIFQ